MTLDPQSTWPIYDAAPGEAVGDAVIRLRDHGIVGPFRVRHNGVLVPVSSSTAPMDAEAAARRLRAAEEEFAGAGTVTYHEEPDRRPHSRACGFIRHGHGGACNRNCPTCAGRPLDQQERWPVNLDGPSGTAPAEEEPEPGPEPSGVDGFAPDDLRRILDLAAEVAEVARRFGRRLVVEAWDSADHGPVAWVEVHPDDSAPAIRFEQRGHQRDPHTAAIAPRFEREG